MRLNDADDLLAKETQAYEAVKLELSEKIANGTYEKYVKEE